MAMSTAASSISPLVYIECDIPAGMTVQAWRASRAAGDERATLMSGVLRRIRRVRRARRRQGA
jgi:hypothetical protein